MILKLELFQRSTMRLDVGATVVYVNPVAEGWGPWERPADVVIVLEDGELSTHGSDELQCGAEGALKPSTQVWATRVFRDAVKARPPLREDGKGGAALRDRVHLLVPARRVEAPGFAFELVEIDAAARFPLERYALLLTIGAHRVLHVYVGAAARASHDAVPPDVDLLILNAVRTRPFEEAEQRDAINRLVTALRPLRLYVPKTKGAEIALGPACKALAAAGRPVELNCSKHWSVDFG